MRDPDSGFGTDSSPVVDEQSKIQNIIAMSQYAASQPTTVTVEKGDTLSSIAKDYGVSVSDILSANPKFTNNPKYKGGNMIWSGTTVKIPGTNTNPYTYSGVNTTTLEGINKASGTILTPSTTDNTDTNGNNTNGNNTDGNNTDGNNNTDNTDNTNDNKDDNSTTTITDNSNKNNNENNNRYIPPVYPQPLTPPTVVDPPVPPPPVRTAPIDTILFNDETVAIEVMTDLIFENIGGHELIDIARNDTINGQSIIYQPIKNLNTIQQRYNPNNIVALQQTSDKYFEGFAIKLEEKTPNTGNGNNGEYIYIDDENGDIIIELSNIYEGEQVEVQISRSGTIYEVNI